MFMFDDAFCLILTNLNNFCAVLILNNGAQYDAYPRWNANRDKGKSSSIVNPQDGDADLNSDLGTKMCSGLFPKLFLS